MSITVNHLSYVHPDGQSLFQEISFALNHGEKVALVGNNGSGKSTLLQMIAGVLTFSKGDVSVDGSLYFVPQHFGQYDHMSVAEALGINKKTDALHAILEGRSDDFLFTDLDDDWGIEERVQAAFADWKIPEINLSQKMETLSGGEKTKVFLSGIAIHEPSVILFDEPSNHLDWTSRQQLYHFIDSSGKTMLIISHDRTLLNLVERTLELGENGIIAYGGNYDFYKRQKEEKDNALFEKMEEQEKALRKAKLTARKTQERKQKRDVRAKKGIDSKGIPRIMLNTIKDRAETTASKQDDAHAKKIAGIHEELQKLRKQTEQLQILKTKVGNTTLHTGKALVEAKHVNVLFQGRFLWEKPLSFHIASGDRLAIAGRNGIGKTTLLKLITGELLLSTGTIKRSECNIVYVDQEYSLLDKGLTVLEQVERYNERHLPEHELKIILHRFVFPSQDWNKKTECLSGGEKMRLLFCCLIVKDHAPDMFVLDEPTNNLDIRTLEIVTDTIRRYRGTLLLVSHDHYFIHEAGVEIIDVEQLMDL